ncbi:MAG TPA: family 1 glycosylhydrolase, partial [Candidatus Omnitrophota bacterium]|nr:family 1 glycosylhydrolase [Candidatus Omnitrophota bacterium]
LDRFSAKLRNKLFNLRFIDVLAGHKALDFLGINYYSRQLVEVKGLGLRSLLGDVCSKGHHPLKKNSLGWDIYPQGIQNILLEVKKYRLPVLITENGICTSDDNTRWEYIKDHLENVHSALLKGVPVIGYLYWSLIDNFEWDKGFCPRFGLVDIDYSSCKRTIRDSAKKLAEVYKTGIL